MVEPHGRASHPIPPPAVRLVVSRTIASALDIQTGGRSRGRFVRYFYSQIVLCTLLRPPDVVVGPPCCRAVCVSFPPPSDSSRG